MTPSATGTVRANSERPSGWFHELCTTDPIISRVETKGGLDVEENVRTLVSAGAVFRQGDNSNGDATANSLSALLQRVSGNSTREIDTLIRDLHDLREKLRADGERIHRDIVDYAALSQQVMQLSKIISESVKRLPDTPGVKLLQALRIASLPYCQVPWLNFAQSQN